MRSPAPVLLLVLLLVSHVMIGGVSNPVPIDLVGASLDVHCSNAPSEGWNRSDPWAPSSSERCAPGHPGALVLTLDDRAHLASWWEHRDGFLERDIRLTMFIDRTDRLNATEWSWLAAFQSDGHEIGLHGRSHESVIEHIDAGGTVESFVDGEVLPELASFEEHGITPTAYSYPDGHRTPESDGALLEHFAILRATDRWRGNGNLPRLVEPADQRVVVGLSTDREHAPLEGILERLDEAHRLGSAVITYGHRLDPEPNPYHTTEPSDLFDLAERAHSLGMPLLTISELAEPAHRLGLEHMYGFLRTGNLTIADRMLENCWTLPRFEEVCFEGATPSWNEDPYGENYWRFIFYGLRPLRHLLHAWEVGGSEEHRKALIGYVADFDREHRSSPWVYVHHADRHGAAFRAMVLTEIRWTLAHGGALSAEEAEMFDRLISETAAFLMREESFESGYNHGFTQAAALRMVAINHPHLAGSRAMDELARERLDQMMERVIGGDGVIIENAPHYQVYVLGKIGEIRQWGIRNGVPQPGGVTSKVPAMVDYVVHVSHPDGSLPQLGASIPDHGVDASGLRIFESERPDLAWLRSRGAHGHPPEESVAWFPSAGQLTWRSSWTEPQNETSHLVLDIGPYRTTHSDLDATHLVWWAGRPILIDPGLYTYEAGLERDFFHGSSAHNLMVLDGRDQDEGGPHSTDVSWIHEEGGAGCAWAAHDLYGGVVDRWTCVLDRDALLVVDGFRSSVQRECELWWHVAPDLHAEVNGTGWDLSDGAGGDMKVRSLHSEKVRLDVVTGGSKPLQGWVSDGYESKVPAAALRMSMVADEGRIASLFLSGGDTVSLTGSIDADGGIVTVAGSERIWRIELPAVGTSRGFSPSSSPVA